MLGALPLTRVLQQEVELVLQLVPRHEKFDVDDAGLGQVGVDEALSSLAAD